LEHRGELISACTYRSRKVTVTVPPDTSFDEDDEDDDDSVGSVKTRSCAAKMW
jgi:hypothetical protein